ncbi:MAG: hypothetical protein ABJM06_14975 [Gilvibacter sp.]
MNKVYLILILLSPLGLFAQGFITLDTLPNIPIEISQKVSGPLEFALSIDFNGDGANDYIVKQGFRNKLKPSYFEYWFTSDFELFLKRERYHMGINISHFVNIDNDPEPEIFSADGYEDGIDYAFYDIDLQKRKTSLLFYFNPVIIDKNKEYWGYPWDIIDIHRIKKENGSVLLWSSVKHNIIRDGNIQMPKDQPIFPVIFFKGKTTQPQAKVEEIEERKWMTITEIIKTVHNKTYKQ